MQINKIWNPLTYADDKQVIEVKNNLTPNQVIAEAGLVFKRPYYLLINGEPLGRDEWDTYRIQETDKCHFVEIPGIATIASFVATTIFSMMSTATLSAMHAAVAWAIVGTSYIAATGIVLGGLSLINRFLAQAPVVGGGNLLGGGNSQQKEIGKGDEVYSISTGYNQARINSPFAEQFGKLKIYPDLALPALVRNEPIINGHSNSNVTSLYSNAKQGFSFLGIVGIGYYEIDKVCIGDTKLAIGHDTQHNSFVQILEPGEIVTETLYAGSSMVYANNNLSGNKLNCSPYDLVYHHAIVCPAGEKVFGAYIDLQQPNGCYAFDNTGGFFSTGGFLTLYYREVDDNGDPVGAGTWTSYFTGTHTHSDGTVFTDVLPIIYYCRNYSSGQIKISFPYGGRWEIKIAFKDPHFEETNYVTDLYIGQIRGTGFIFSTRLPTLPANVLKFNETLSQCTLVSVFVWASAEINGNITDKINVTCTRKLYPVTATGFDTSARVATRSIVDAVAYMVTSDNGGKQSEDLLDFESLADLRASLETSGWYFDYRFQTRMSVMEACAMAARCGCCVPYIPGKFLLIQDKEQTTPSMKFTAEDYDEGSFKLSHNLHTADDPTGIEIHCIDATTWQDTTVECFDEDGSDENMAVVELSGCTSRQQAYDIGMYMYLDNKYNRTDVEFSTGLQGHIPLPGSRIMIDIPAADSFRHSGLIHSIDGTTVVLSEAIEWGSKTTGVLYLTGTAAALIGPYTATPGTSDYIVTATLPVGTKTVETDAKNAARYLFAFSADETTSMRVTSIRPNDQNSVRIAGTIYGSLPYVAHGTVPESAIQGLLDSASLAYLGIESDAYSYICAWTGTATSVRIELDEGSGYVIKEDLYTSGTYEFSVASAIEISLKVTPYDEGVLSTEDAIVQTYSVPGTVTNLALVGTVGEEWEVSWTAVTGTDQYRINIVVDGAVVASLTETSTGRSFTLSDMIAWGGPYDSWTITVAAEIDGNIGKLDTLDLNYTGWDPTGLIVEPGLGSATLTATYVKTNSFEACEIWISETNDRTVAYKIGETGGSSFVALGLDDGSTYYFWCKVRLAGNVYTGWYPESETGGVECLIDYIPDAVTDIVAEATSEGVQVSWTDQIFESGVLYGDILEDAKHWHYKITEGATYETSAEVGRSLSSPFVIKFPGPGTILSAGTKTFWVVVVSSSDVESPATNSASLTIYAPYTPSISTEWDSDVLRLSWSDCKRTLDIDYYEVRHYVTAEGIDTAKTDKIKGLFAQYPLDWMDSKTFSVRAVDKAGNAGSYDTKVVTDAIGNYGTTGEAVTATADGMQVSWTNIFSDCPVKEYKISVGSIYSTSTELGRVTVSPFILRWPFSTKLPSGSNRIWIVGVDTVGNESATSYVDFSINVPSTPVISTEWKSDVLRLSWASCKSTFEIDYYEVTHYITAEGSGTAKTDKIKGLFAQYPLDWMDSKTFSVKAVDKAGFTGSTDTEVVTDPIGSCAVSSVVASAVENGIQVTWTNISATPVKEYKVTVGSTYATSTEIGRVAVSPFVLKWPCSTKVISGSNRFWVVGVDIVGNESVTAYDDFTISLPSTPSVTTERSKDIVRFTWASCKTTFDIDHYRIEATLDAVTTTDKVIGLYAEYKLDWVGTKTFKFYAVDKAGFESSSYDSESVTVSAVGAPTALTTSGGVYEVAVSVTFPTNEYFAGCEIWATTSNNRTYAKKIAEVSSAENPATVVKKLKAELADSWYFWAKSKDIYGNYSTWYPSGSTSGVLGAPSTTPSDYVDALSGAIDYDDFVASLQAGLGTDIGGTWTYYTGEGYSLYINESGNITGWRNFIDIDAPTVNTFDIWANKFRIINYDDETQLPVVPFMVGTVNGSSMVGINGNLIVDGTILGRHIKATETITLNSGGTLSIGNAGSIEIGVGGSITILGGMTGYAQISDKPDSLSDINSTEGTKLTGIADNADVTGENTAADTMLVGGSPASTVRDNAANAKIAVDYMAADNILSVQEKMTWRIQWPGMQKNYENILAKATAYGIQNDSVFTTFTTKRNQFYDYLANTLHVWDQPDTDASMTSGKLSSYVEDYYNASVTAINRLTDYAASTAIWTEVTGEGKPEDGATVGAPAGTYVNGVLAETLTDDVQNALSAAANAQDTADGKIQSFYQDAEPTAGMSLGDIWVDTNDGNKLYRYNGSSWVSIRDSSISEAQITAATAITNAATAQSTADGKVMTFFGTTTPTAEGIGDLWYDDSVKLLKRWTGSSWVVVSNNYTDTNQLTDGAGLGMTATWANIDGTGKPEDNADVTDYEDTRVANAILENDVLRVINPIGASRSFALQTITGAIKITLPQFYTNTMMQFSVDVYNYNTTKSFQLNIGGYPYSGTPKWDKTSVSLIGNINADNRVRFGNDGSKCCIWIGETTSIWSHPKVSVTNFQAGHSHYSKDEWVSGWNIDIVDTIDTVDINYPDSLIDAKAIKNQGALATSDIADWSTQVTGEGKPEDGATVGADWSTNLDNRPNELTDGRIIAGFDSNGNVIRNISGPLLPTTSPTDEGLYINQEHLGYWSGTDWNSYIDKYGNFQFLGDELNYITWNSLDGILDIRGALVADDIVSGTLSAARIGASSIDTTKLTFDVINEDYITNGQYHLSQIYDDGGTLTISSGSIVLATAGDLTINSGSSVQVNAANGIEVNSGGGVTVNDGGDITLLNDTNVNPGKIIWEDATGSFSMFTSNDAICSCLYLQGDPTIDLTNFYVNFYVRGMDEIGLFFKNLLTFADNSGSFNASFVYYDGHWTLKGDSSADFIFFVRSESKGLFHVTPSTVETEVDFLPTLNGFVDIGSSSHAFEQGYINKVYAERVEQSNADAFQVKLFSDQQNFAVGSNVTVRFASKTNDHTAAFNTTTYTYTAQGDGWRQFNLKLWIYGGFYLEATQLTAYIVTSNETFEFAIRPATIQDAYGNFQISGSILAYMDNGDTAFVRIYQNGDTQHGNISAAYSYFSAYYVNN